MGDNRVDYECHGLYERREEEKRRGEEKIKIKIRLIVGLCKLGSIYE